MRPVSQTFDLREAVMEVYDMMVIKSGQKGLYLKFEQDYFDQNMVSNLPAKVTGDKCRMQQVFINLVTNAVNNTYDGGVTIHLSYDASSQMIRISVMDTGIGIKPQDQIDLFKMLKSHDVSSDKSLKKSPGLGLKISKMIVKKFDGKLWFTSVP
jgi:signal transduction histidine kinase